MKLSCMLAGLHVPNLCTVPPEHVKLCLYLYQDEHKIYEKIINIPFQILAKHSGLHFVFVKQDLVCVKQHTKAALIDSPNGLLATRGQQTGVNTTLTYHHHGNLFWQMSQPTEAYSHKDTCTHVYYIYIIICSRFSGQFNIHCPFSSVS